MTAVALLFIAACKPYEVDDVDISGPTPQVSFSWSYLPDDSNQIVLQSTGESGFLYNWDFGNGQSGSGTTDTAYYPVAGDYNVRLTVANRSGTGFASQSVQILTSDDNLCSNPTLLSLCGSCADVDGERWTFSLDAGAITVGSTPGAGDFFVSTAGGLVVEQYDDFYDFIYEESDFNYINNGLTVFPEAGYEALPYDPDPNATWTFSPGTGIGGADQILLSPETEFMGTKDSGPIYDVVAVTDSTLVVWSEIRGGAGWFEFKFVKF